MLVQRVAFLLAVAHAAARPAGPKARALPRQQAAQRRKGWTAKLKFLRDDWQEAVLRPRGGASSTQAALRPRGGASSLTTLTHAALGAVFEAGALLGVVKAARALAPGASSAIARLKILPSDTIKGLPAAEWFAWCVIIFGSSAVGAVVDGSLRAATNQILMPTRVAGEQGWYASLDKPRWEPPGFVFPVMWLLVSKPTQLLAVAKVCSSGTSEGEEAAALPWVPQLAAYCLHLALGDAWNKVFFGQQKVRYAACYTLPRRVDGVVAGACPTRPHAGLRGRAHDLSLLRRAARVGVPVLARRPGGGVVDGADLCGNQPVG